jgi:hypothetical protein
VDQVVAEIEPGSWFVLAEKIASDVPSNDWEMLGISQVQQSDVLHRLQGDIDFSKINGANFSDAARETILAVVEDEHVWRGLPLHIDTEGTIGCADVDCFHDTGRAARQSWPTVVGSFGERIIASTKKSKSAGFQDGPARPRLDVP